MDNKSALPPDHPDSPEKTIRRFAVELGLQPGFFFSLRREADDWSFVIKLHALVEAAITHLVTEECGHQELLDIFARLELSNLATGKIAFAKALSCLDKGERRVIRQISEIRNEFVHDVKNTGLSLSAYVERLDSHQYKNFRETFGPGMDPLPGKMTEDQWVRGNPRLCIWLTAMVVIALAYHRKRTAAAKNDLVRALRDAVRESMEHDTTAGAHKAEP